VLRIARKVARDRVIFTVDPDARHGHKTSHRGFDGYKGHVALDPDSELVTATTATAGTSGDADVAEQLLADVLPAELSPSANRSTPRAPSALRAPRPSGSRSTVIAPTAPGRCSNAWRTQTRRAAPYRLIFNP
jgi:hypothetical protein